MGEQHLYFTSNDDLYRFVANDAERLTDYYDDTRRIAAEVVDEFDPAEDLTVAVTGAGTAEDPNVTTVALPAGTAFPFATNGGTFKITGAGAGNYTVLERVDDQTLRIVDGLDHNATITADDWSLAMAATNLLAMGDGHLVFDSAGYLSRVANGGVHEHVQRALVFESVGDDFETITITNHGLSNGDQVTYWKTDNFAPEILLQSDGGGGSNLYQVINSDANSFQLALPSAPLTPLAITEGPLSSDAAAHELRVEVAAAAPHWPVGAQSLIIHENSRLYHLDVTDAAPARLIPDTAVTSLTELVAVGDSHVFYADNSQLYRLNLSNDTKTQIDTSAAGTLQAGSLTAVGDENLFFVGANGLYRTHVNDAAAAVPNAVGTGYNSVSDLTPVGGETLYFVAGTVADTDLYRISMAPGATSTQVGAGVVATAAELTPVGDSHLYFTDSDSNKLYRTDVASSGALANQVRATIDGQAISTLRAVAGGGSGMVVAGYYLQSTSQFAAARSADAEDIRTNDYQVTVSGSGISVDRDRIDAPGHRFSVGDIVVYHSTDPFTTSSMTVIYTVPAPVAYTAGTVTNSGDTVTLSGIGPAWPIDAADRVLQVAGVEYEVASRQSDRQITLTREPTTNFTNATYTLLLPNNRLERVAIGLAERIDALDGLQAAADEEQIHIHSEDPTEKIRTGACAAGDYGNIDVVECVPGTTTLKLTGSASVGEQWSVELTYRTGRILPLTQGESYTVVQSTADWFQLEAGDTGTAIDLVAAGNGANHVFQWDAADEDSIKIVNHGFVDNDIVQYQPADDVLIGGLTSGNEYTISRCNARPTDCFQLLDAAGTVVRLTEPAGNESLSGSHEFKKRLAAIEVLRDDHQVFTVKLAGRQGLESDSPLVASQSVNTRIDRVVVDNRNAPIQVASGAYPLLESAVGQQWGAADLAGIVEADNSVQWVGAEQTLSLTADSAQTFTLKFKSGDTDTGSIVWSSDSKHFSSGTTFTISTSGTVTLSGTSDTWPAVEELQDAGR